MRDEFDARAWCDHHHHLANGLGRLWADLQAVVDRLHAYHYDAPWQNRRGTERR